jgi:uncharacterized protein YjbI with pentapeptide repeats
MSQNVPENACGADARRITIAAGMSGGAFNFGCILPRRAAVTPRATLHGQSASLPIEQWAEQLFQRNPHACLGIFGEARAGKTTALSHLASVFSGKRKLAFLDEPEEPMLRDAAVAGGLIFTSRQLKLDGPWQYLFLSPWTDEDLIEYLLAMHPQWCKSVMSRITSDEHRARLFGSPHLWRIVLDEMASDESVPDTSVALCRAIDRMLSDDAAITCAGRLAMWQVCKHPQFAKPKLPDIHLSVLPLLEHRVVQLLLACEQIVWRLSMSVECEELAETMPPDVIDEIARRARHRPAVLQRLDELSNCKRHVEQQAMTMSALVAADPSWRPKRKPELLIYARLCGAQWAGVDLRGTTMRAADFSRADLSTAMLSGASANQTVFSRAKLRDAMLLSLHATEADFTAADLRDANLDSAELHRANFQRADLRGAQLREAQLFGAKLNGAKLAGAQARASAWDWAQLEDADLREVNFSHANLAGVDLTRAELNGASFFDANLCGAKLEGVEMVAPCFRQANLTQADLTGSSLRHGDFRNADLREAGLADIDWEGADLRGADFSNASFHLGSSRSGLVGSTLACEGSKTGFYTDEFDEQDFKAPEEIRKANLRGANLIGAIVDRTDWYLVDLRGAKYSREQAQHFAHCGAILRSRVC